MVRVSLGRNRTARRARKRLSLKGGSPGIKQVAVCQASKCRKRGSQALAKLLDQEIAAQGLECRVETKRGGCNSLCDQGPSMVVQPDRVWYAELSPEAIRRVVSEHLSGGEPVRKWVAKDKGRRGRKTARKALEMCSKEREKRSKKALKAAKKAGKSSKLDPAA